MATFSSSFGAKERKTKRASSARHYTHRNPFAGSCTLGTFNAGDGATVRVYMDGDTCAVITLRNGRLDGQPSFTKGYGSRNKALTQARLLAKTLKSGAVQQADPRSEVARYTANLLAGL